MTQMGFYFDANLCIGCKACQVACKDDNDLEVGTLWRRVVEVEGGGWIPQGPLWGQNIGAYYLSIACNHCEKPICEEVCPSGAIAKRDDGIVLIDEDKCIGCRYCEWACPYAAPQYQSDKGKMSKCDFCFDYVDQGLSPACVAACPMRALDFGDVSELRAKYTGVAAVYPMPDPSLTEPAFVVAPNATAAAEGMHGLRLANMEEI